MQDAAQNGDSELYVNTMTDAWAKLHFKSACMCAHSRSSLHAVSSGDVFCSKHLRDTNAE